MHALTRLSLSIGLGLALLGGGHALAEAATRVFVNGKPTPVHFNDGDSFRVLAGPLKGSKARLAGFNTLESYGAVHRWGTWTTKELYFVAKMGTLNGRQGIWHCNTDMKRDGYGRLLLDCPDLVADQIRRGFAHAMTITPDPAPADMMALQKQAQAEGLGIWAHGIPEYILTSTHSSAESFDAGKLPYNRLVSTSDGHSKRWNHNNKYDECEDVCYVPVRLDAKKVRVAVRDLKADEKLSKYLADVDDEALAVAIEGFVESTGMWPKDVVPEKAWNPLSLKVDDLREAGALGELVPEDQSCMIYVDFRRRFGSQRATCLD